MMINNPFFWQRSLQIIPIRWYNGTQYSLSCMCGEKKCVLLSCTCCRPDGRRKTSDMYLPNTTLAQSAGAIEYTDCISAEG